MSDTTRLIIFGLSLSGMASAQQRPNIIYIMTDQQAGHAMSCTGNGDVKTPNMDRLANRGIRFQNAYCALPLSGPSRAAMMTGYVPSEIGMQENETPLPDSLRHNTLGNIMAKAGYACAYAGKWHVNTNALPAPTAFGLENLHGHEDTGLAEACIGFLKRKHDRPFFLVASFNNPHGICEYARHQNPPFGHINEPDIVDCPQLPSNFAVNPYDATALAYEKQQNHRLYPSAAYSADDWRRYLNAYYRLIETVDGEIGKIVSEIDRQNLWANTVVIFTSDHGDGAASHQWNQKTALYENVANIPFIVCTPTCRQKGSVSNYLLNNGEDLLPTILDYAQIDIPSKYKGTSIRKAVEADKDDVPERAYVVTETVFAQTAGTLGWMVRTPHYKYILYDTGKYREQLYDMVNDRGEMRNLAVDGRYRQVVKSHRRMLAEWMERHPSKATGMKHKYIPRDEQ